MLIREPALRISSAQALSHEFILRAGRSNHGTDSSSSDDGVYTLHRVNSYLLTEEASASISSLTCPSFGNETLALATHLPFI